MHKCKYCGKEFDSGIKLGGHVVWCKNNPSVEETRNKIIEGNTIKNPTIDVNLICACCGKTFTLKVKKIDFDKDNFRKTCSKDCALNLTKCHTDIESRNRSISKSIIDRFIRANDLYNDIHILDDGRIYRKRTCKNCGIEFMTQSKTSEICSCECRKKYVGRKISEAVKGKTGGLRENSYKRYKSGNYRGIHCDSSYELAFLVYNIEHNIDIERNRNYLTYAFDGRQFKYYPDFVIDGVFYEIKGYESDKDRAKREQHPEVVQIDKDGIQPYMDYVVEKYGKDFTNKLYE